MDQASKWYKKSRPIASAFILGGVVAYSLLRSKKLSEAFPCFTSLCEADMVSLSDYCTLFQRDNFNSFSKKGRCGGIPTLLLFRFFFSSRISKRSFSAQLSLWSLHQGRQFATVQKKNQRYVNEFALSTNSCRFFL